MVKKSLIHEQSSSSSPWLEKHCYPGLKSHELPPQPLIPAPCLHFPAGRGMLGFCTPGSTTGLALKMPHVQLCYHHLFLGCLVQAQAERRLLRCCQHCCCYWCVLNLWGPHLIFCSPSQKGFLFFPWCSLRNMLCGRDFIPCKWWILFMYWLCRTQLFTFARTAIILTVIVKINWGEK